MSDAETQLLQLLKERSFKRGTFRLASGDLSDYYIDGKMTQVFSEAAHLIGEVLYEHTKDLAIDGIGGLEVGAVPLTTAAVISYHLHGRKMEGFWVRDKAKSHGTTLLVNQLKDFPAGDHDDGPDALEMAVRLAGEMLCEGNAE